MARITGIRTHIFIGKYELFRCPLCAIDFDRYSHLSTAQVVVADPSGELYRGMSPGDEIQVRFGFRDQVPEIWHGSVTRLAPNPKKDQVVVRAVGIEKPLSDTLIKMSFLQEDPAAIVRYCVEQAGMEIGRIDSPGIVFPRFTASNIPVWQVARQCESTCQNSFGIDMAGWVLWVGADGKVNWGNFDEDKPRIQVIETGKNLIRHIPAPGENTDLGSVEAFLIPELRRCMPFRLKDIKRGVDSLLSTRHVQHVLRPHGVRTYINYRGDA